jgi:hypothetical protein
MFILKPTQQNLIGLVKHLQPQSMFDIVFHYEFESVDPDGDEAVGIVRTISFPQGSTSSTIKTTRGPGLSSSPHTPQTLTRTRPSIVPKRDDLLQPGTMSVSGASTNFRSRIIATPAFLEGPDSAVSQGTWSYTCSHNRATD